MTHLCKRVFGAAIAAALVLSLPCGRASAQGSADPLADRVDSLFVRYNRGDSPGIAVAVVRDGQMLLHKGYGLADIEHRIPITASTVFDVASVSKQFTGLTVAMLITQGKVKLSDDIRKYIPELPKFDQVITVEHLLHHTSGIRDWPGTLSVGGWSYDDVISFQQILTMAYNQRALNFVPGAEHFYSNTGYNILAEMVQRVTGKSFRAHTDAVIFRPLGMTNSHFRDDHTEVVPNLAYGYARRPDGTFRHTPNALTALGSSSLFSTVDDLAKWLANFDKAKVGGQEAMTLAHMPGRLNNGTSVPYAFGISNGTFRGLPTLTHSGSWASFLTYVLWFPQQKVGIVTLSNSGSINAADAANRIAAIYLEKELGPATATNAARPTTTTVNVDRAVLDEYAGLYRLGPGWYTRIRRDGSSLTSQATNEGVASMTARSEQEFWIENYGASMTFRRDSSGRVAYLEYRGNRAPRVDERVVRAPGALTDYVGEYASDELGTSYQVSLKDGKLEMLHRRHGTIALVAVMGDEFSGNLWFLKSVQFVRDSNGRVNGLVVNGDLRSRDIRFARVR